MCRNFRIESVQVWPADMPNRLAAANGTEAAAANQAARKVVADEDTRLAAEEQAREKARAAVELAEKQARETAELEEVRGQPDTHTAFSARPTLTFVHGRILDTAFSARANQAPWRGCWAST